MNHALSLKFVARFVVSVALLAGITLSVNAQPVRDALDDYLQSQVANQRVPGLTFVLVDAEGNIDIRTYGEGITPQTRFYIGSLSKAMTAVAVMQLVDAGLIDLDTPVQTYIPTFTTQDAEHASRIAVRHLLNQTSGLADQGHARDDNETDLAALVAEMASARHLAEPGAAFAYFNPNYDVLGYLIEVVTGESYADYLRANLFDPLEMTDALAHNPAPETVERLAQGYILPFGFPVAYPPQTVAASSGGIIASGRDMGAFLRLFVGSESVILRGESRALLFNPPFGLESAYGMGWFVKQLDDGTPIYEHSGDVPTFHADMMLLPEEDIAFALLYNRQYLLSAFTSFPQIRYGVAAILRGDEPSSGLSAGILGLIILAVVIISVISDLRRLFLSRRWAETARQKSRIVVVFGLITLLAPMAILLLLPALILALTGRALGNYGLVFALLPDVMLFLFISVALGLLTLIARIFLLARGM
jgi:CubicO group peptidase (beta-lactamase class C family)